MAERLKTGLAIFGLSILAVVAAELLARAVLFVDDTFFDPGSSAVGSVDPKARLPAFEAADYDPVQVFEDQTSIGGSVYVPYSVWSHRPFKGKLVNVDDHGNRVTVHNSLRKDSLQVWVLGGSTTWGTGAPDAETIPSYIARFFNEWGADTQVRNLGEHAFVSTQEVIYLLREVQAGQRPDVVLFYDGVNDSASAALWPEAPGSHQSLGSIRRRFEGKLEQEAVATRLARSTGLYRVAHFALKRVGIADDLQTETSNGGVQLLQVAAQAFDIWLENYKIAAILGDGYGFIPVFVFHPALGVGEKPMDSSEADLLADVMEHPAQGPTTRVNIEFHRLLQQSLSQETAPENLHDLSDIFAEVSDPIYMDWTHLTGKGNRIVAEGFSKSSEASCATILRLTSANLPEPS